MNLNSINTFSVYLFLFSFFFISEKTLINCENNGKFYFRFICLDRSNRSDYSNYCDSPTDVDPPCRYVLKICISNKNINETSISNCPVLFKITTMMRPKDRPCNKLDDNQKSMQNVDSQDVEITNQTIFFIKIDTQDVRKEDSLISFFGNFSHIAASYGTSLHYTEINLYPSEFKYQRYKLKSKFSIAIQCKENQYGEYCSKACKETTYYNCSSDGNKICKEECINNGTCKREKFSTRCKCLQGVYEVNCEDKNMISLKSTEVYQRFTFSSLRLMYVAIFVIVFILSIIALIWYTTKKQKMKGFSFKKLFELQVNMNDMEESPRQVPVYEL